MVSNYISGQHNTFAYKLEGYDKEWYYLTDSRTVSYSNLPQGTYQFLVKAANSDGKWNPIPTALEIIVLPIWYKTWWALLIFFATFAGFITFVFRFFWMRKSMEAQLEIERRDKEHQEEINQMILKKLKPDGLINSDEKAYRGMDRDFEKSSDVIPVTLKKDQTPAAGSKVANAEEFDVITRFAREKLREIGREIYDGNVAVNPIKNKKIDSCAYCAFQAICRYDSRIPGFSERSFNGDNKEDVLDKMRTQIAAAEHKACYGDNNIKP